MFVGTTVKWIEGREQEMKSNQGDNEKSPLFIHEHILFATSGIVTLHLTTPEVPKALSFSQAANLSTS